MGRKSRAARIAREGGADVGGVPAEALGGGADSAPAASVGRAKKAREYPSVMSFLKTLQKGDEAVIADIAALTRNTEVSVRTTALACNSTAASNKRFHATGMRFTRQGAKLVCEAAYVPPGEAA